MSTSVLTLTPATNGLWADNARTHAVGTIGIAAGDYVTGGFTMDFQANIPHISTSKQPIWVDIRGIAGYKYEYDYTNKKIIIRQTGTVTPAGTNSAPAFTGSALATHAHDLLVKGGQIASTTNDIAHYATDILGKEAATDATITGAASATKGGVIATTAGTPAGTVAAPVFTGTATTAAPGAQLAAAATPAAVVSDTITYYCIFPKLG